MDEVSSGILWYLGFLLSVTCHEAAHAWAALRGGDPTAYEGGQVTLDPIPHIRRSPVGMVLMPVASIALIGFPMGFASAPYNVAWADRYPKRAAWMALAGPASNLLILVLAGIGFWIGESSGVFARSASPHFDQIVRTLDGGLWPTIAHLLSILFSMNLILFVLNMLPVPPLDGASALGILVNEATARRMQAAMRNPAYSMIGLLLAWNFFGEIFQPIFVLALNLIFPGAGYGLR